ncbi:VOC family protein [Priestia aryabhattai]|uniref:VOC family protein n=1 Tax=Priestia aryabhattai TaxID=412384 RepID=UPI003D29CA3F
MKPLLGNRNINQIAFVVNDIEVANEAFTKLLGIKKVEPFLTGDSSISKVVFKGESTNSQSKLAFLNTPTVQFELIEPDKNPGTMREFLDNQGEGIHHIAFDVDAIQKKLPVMKKSGYSVLQTGEFTLTDGRYAYVDTLNDYKTLVELLESAKPRETNWEQAADENLQPLLGTNKVEQIAFVVKNLNATADAYCKLLGVKKPEIINSGPPEVTNVIYEGKATEGTSRYMFINTPLIQIELIEPGDTPSTWKTHLENVGEGAHHISFVVKNMEEKIRMLEEMGYPVIQTGNFFNGKGRYAYMDTRSTYKVIIELLERKEI